MNFDEIVRTHYFHETERRRELNAALSIPLGVLTALFAAIAAMLSSLTLPFQCVELAIAVPCGLAAGAGFISIYQAFRSYLGYTYRHPTSMGGLSDWRTDALAQGISRHRVGEDIQRIMTEQYVAGAERNSANNDRKSGHIHRAGVWLAVCLVLVIVAGVPYIYLKMTTPAGGATQSAPATRLEVLDREQRPPSATASTPTAPASSDARHSGERNSAQARLD